MTARRKDGYASLYKQKPNGGQRPLHNLHCSHWCLSGASLCAFPRSRIYSLMNFNTPFRSLTELQKSAITTIAPIYLCWVGLHFYLEKPNFISPHG
ncbi:Protein trichome birefringence-like [Melia azedarach]|uniref:Protein trichome birefringence-like n=1 Tax=Melia azedarach TaxID=155640 RepID=A0ACC1YVI8_MELAZ|nr:Protein trichome birefringence-like [Melia azedarach]